MSERVESCKEFVKRVRSCWENCKVSERVESCKEFVRRIVRCLNEWRVVRSLLREL